MPSEGIAELMARAADLERRGEWSEMGAVFAALFQQGVAQHDPRIIVDALRGQARALYHSRQYEEAIELAEASWWIADRHGLPQEAARALNMVAVVHFACREYDLAKGLYEQALERAVDVGDDELIGRICQNLGVVANITGDLREARVRYLESIGAAIRSGRKVNEAMAYNNLGMVCADIGEYLEAELYFDRGIEIAERIGDRAQTARLYANRAEPLLRVGEYERASESLDRAEEIARQIDARGTQADVERYRGVLARLRSDFAAAEQHLLRALAMATDAHLELVRAETTEELARLFWVQEAVASAIEQLETARGIFEALGAEQDVHRIDDLLCEWRVTSGVGNRHAADAAVPQQ